MGRPAHHPIPVIDTTQLPLAERVGYNYAATIRELTTVMTWQRIIEAIGYSSHSVVAEILNGQIPNHVQGEALWALYCDTFGKKPPLDAPRRHPS